MTNDISYYCEDGYFGYKETENFENFLKNNEFFPIIKNITSVRDDYGEFRVIIECNDNTEIVVKLI